MFVYVKNEFSVYNAGPGIKILSNAKYKAVLQCVLSNDGIILRKGAFL